MYIHPIIVILFIGANFWYIICIGSELMRLKSALEFYANRSLNKDIDDFGRRARDVLAPYEQMEKHFKKK